MRRFLSSVLLCYWGIIPAAADPLLDTCRANHAEHIARLINGGGDVRERGAQGDTPLHRAAFHGSETIVAQLIARGANVQLQCQLRSGLRALIINRLLTGKTLPTLGFVADLRFTGRSSATCQLKKSPHST
jgi:ankyrin repeat protein